MPGNPAHAFRPSYITQSFGNECGVCLWIFKPCFEVRFDFFVSAKMLGYVKFRVSLFAHGWLRLLSQCNGPLDIAAAAGDARGRVETF
jgi:hypothetical protein